MNHEREEKHIISTLVENHFGVLARVSGLLSSRGFNIDSLAVAETTDPDTSRMTIVTRGDERIIEQIIKQLYRLVDVIKVVDLAECPHVERVPRQDSGLLASIDHCGSNWGQPQNWGYDGDVGAVRDNGSCADRSGCVVA